MLALRFVSGRYQGGEFALHPGKEIVLGRSSEVDMVLVEDMVSRRHARIHWVADEPVIEDLSSTNGTFVNGERIERRTLREGDRVLVGTSIFRIVSSDAPPVPEPWQLPPARPRHPSPADSSPRMTGTLVDVPLPDLLQLFGASKKSGVLLLSTPGETGSIVLTDGVVVTAALEGHPQVGPRKAIYRMVAWTEGQFLLDPPAKDVPGEALDATVQELLMEGLRLHDELVALGELPPRGAPLRLLLPLRTPLRALNETQLDSLQACLEAPTFGALLDASDAADVDIARGVADLLRRGYLTAAPAG